MLTIVLLQELCTLRPGFNDNPVPTRSLLDSPSFDPDFDPGNAFQDALNDIAQRGDSTPNNATTPTTNGPSSQPRIVDNLSYLEAHNRQVMETCLTHWSLGDVVQM